MMSKRPKKRSKKIHRHEASDDSCSESDQVLIHHLRTNKTAAAIHISNDTDMPGSSSMDNRSTKINSSEDDSSSDDDILTHPNRRRLARTVSSSSSSDESITFSRRRKNKKIGVVGSEDDSQGDAFDSQVSPLHATKHRRVPRVQSETENSDEESSDHSEDSDSSENMQWESDWVSDEDTSQKPFKSSESSSKLSKTFLPSSDSESSDGQSEKCPICLRSLSHQEVGTPESCDHCFCAECLQEWAKNVNTCPVDRQLFTLILVRKRYGGKVVRRIPVEPRRLDDVDPGIMPDDATYCEVCGQCDREDRMLLCDGCDLGYHLECLTPPLEHVPLDLWFCPNCERFHSNNQETSDNELSVSDISEESNDSFTVVRTENTRSSSRHTRRVRIPRTPQSERIRATIRTRQRQRTQNAQPSTSNIDSLDADRNSVDITITRRVTVSRKRRKITHKKVRRRKRRGFTKKTTMKKTKKRVKKPSNDDNENSCSEEESFEEEVVVCTKKRRRRRRRKYKKRKIGTVRRPRTARRHPRTARVTVPLTARRRIAEQLGVRPPRQPGQTIPEVKSKIPMSSIDLQRSRAGIPTLHLFGQRNQLDYFSSGSENEDYPEGSGDVTVSSHPRVSAGRLERSYVNRKLAPVDVSILNNSAAEDNYDIVGSILDSQTLWHSKKAQVTIHRDGSLTVKTDNVQKINRDKVSTSGKNVLSDTNVNVNNDDSLSDIAKDQKINVNDFSEASKLMKHAPMYSGRNGSGTPTRPSSNFSQFSNNRYGSSSSFQSYQPGRSFPQFSSPTFDARASRAGYSNFLTGGTPPPLLPPFRSPPPVRYRSNLPRLPQIRRPIVSGPSFPLIISPPSVPQSLSLSSSRTMVSQSSAIFSPIPTRSSQGLNLSLPTPLSQKPDLLSTQTPSVLVPIPLRATNTETFDDDLINDSPVEISTTGPNDDDYDDDNDKEEDVDIYSDIEVTGTSGVRGGGSSEPEDSDKCFDVLPPPPVPPALLMEFGEQSDEEVGSDTELVIDDNIQATSPKSNDENKPYVPESEKYDPANPSYDTDEDDDDDDTDVKKIVTTVDNISVSCDDIPLPSPINTDKDTDNEEEEVYKHDTKVCDTLTNVNISMIPSPVYGDSTRHPSDSYPTTRIEVSDDIFAEGKRRSSSENEEDDTPVCPNFSIYSSESVDIARNKTTVDDLESSSQREDSQNENMSSVEQESKIRKDENYLISEKVTESFNLVSNYESDEGEADDNCDDHTETWEGSVSPNTDEMYSEKEMHELESSKSKAILNQEISSEKINVLSQEETPSVPSLEEVPEESEILDSVNKLYNDRMLSDQSLEGKSPELPIEFSSLKNSAVSDKCLAGEEYLAGTNVILEQNLSCDLNLVEEISNESDITNEINDSQNLINSTPQISSQEFETQENADHPSKLTEENLNEAAELCSKSHTEELCETHSVQSDDQFSELLDEEVPKMQDQSINRISHEMLFDERESHDDSGEKVTEGDIYESQKFINQSFNESDDVDFENVGNKDIEQIKESSVMDYIFCIDNESNGVAVSPVSNTTVETVQPAVISGLEGLETETISETEEAINFEDDVTPEGILTTEDGETVLKKRKKKKTRKTFATITEKSSKIRNHGSVEYEEGEIIDDGQKKERKSLEKRDKSKHSKDANEGFDENKTPSSKTGTEKEKKRKKKKSSDKTRQSRDRTVLSSSENKRRSFDDPNIEWKKPSKSTKERNYRDGKGKADIPSKSLSRRDRSLSKENLKKDKKKREKRKDLERYDVRKVVSDKKRKRKDEFGRDLSRDRSYSRSRSKSRDWSQDRLRNKSRSVSRSRVVRSRNRSPLRSRRSKSRSRHRSLSRTRNKSRSTSRSRMKRKSKDKSRRSRSREKRLRSSRDRSRSRTRSRSRGRHSRTKSRSRSVVRSRVRSRSRTPIRTRDKKDRPHNVAVTVRGERRKRRSWSRTWTPSWSRSRSQSASYSSYSRSHSPSQRRFGRSYSRSFSRSWSRERHERIPLLSKKISKSAKKLTVILQNTKDDSERQKKREKKKKDSRKAKDTMQTEKKKKKKEKSPAPSKEVFTSGDNILVSVNFSKSNKTPGSKDGVPANLITPSSIDLLKRKHDGSFENESLKRLRKEMGPPLSNSAGNNITSEKKKSKKLVKPSPRIAAVMHKKPVAIIDLDQSPFHEQTPSPENLIVLTDSDDEKARNRMSKNVSEFIPGLRDLRHDSLSPKPINMGNIVSADSPARTPEPLSPVINDIISYSMSTGPKTPPEPQVKFSISTKPQLRTIDNPLREEEEILDESHLDMHQILEEDLDRSMDEIVRKGPNTPPEPEGPTTPCSVTNSPEDAYDPFDPTKSGTPSPAGSIEHGDIERSPSLCANLSENLTAETKGLRESPLDNDLEEHIRPMESSVPQITKEEIMVDKLDASPNIPQSQSETQIELSPSSVILENVLPLPALEDKEMSVASAAVEIVEIPDKAKPKSNHLSAINTVESTKSPDIKISTSASLQHKVQLTPTKQPAFTTAVTSSSVPKPIPSQQSITSTPNHPSVPIPGFSTLTPSNILSLLATPPTLGRVSLFNQPTPHFASQRLPVTKAASEKSKSLRPAVQNGEQSSEKQDLSTDVIDMDLESPYSPASSEGDDLFDPPSDSPKRSSSYGLAQIIKKTALSLPTSIHKAPAKTGNQDKFDLLFGSSPVISSKLTSKIPGRSYKSHQSSKLSRSRTAKKEITIKMDEDQLQILDELPSSAVEMQVKDKFLKKLNRQERVVEEVKLCLKPHYTKKHITKDDYKEILRRCVPKICHNKTGEINPVKISALVEAYVKKFRYQRKKNTSAPLLGSTIKPKLPQMSKSTMWS